MGISAIEAIIKARKSKGPFVSFWDFCNKTEDAGLNKRTVESLIRCGAFDSLGAYRSQLIAVYEKILDGISQERDVYKRQELGMPGIAITDHGAMYGVVEFYTEAKARGLKPVIGCEVYLAPRGMRDKDSRADMHYTHLVLSLIHI